MNRDERIIRCKQVSDDWFDLHIGRVTASDVHKCMAFRKVGEKKDGELKIRSDYKTIKIVEILTRLALHDNYVSRDMERGTELEPRARTAYEMATGADVDEVGFVLHPDFPDRCGASPDGLIGKDGGIEIKCPRASTHTKYLLGEEHEYEPQMMLNIRCADLAWMDFVSYCPEMPAHLKLFIKRLHRDEKRIAEIDSAVMQFNAEVDALIERLNEIGHFGTVDQKQLNIARLNAQLEGSLTDADIQWANARERGEA